MPYNPLTANKFYFSTVEDEFGFARAIDPEPEAVLEQRRHKGTRLEDLRVGVGFAPVACIPLPLNHYPKSFFERSADPCGGQLPGDRETRLSQ